MEPREVIPGEKKVGVNSCLKILLALPVEVYSNSSAPKSDLHCFGSLFPHSQMELNLCYG